VVCVAISCAAAFGTGGEVLFPIPDGWMKRKAALDSALEEAQRDGAMAEILVLFTRQAGSANELDKRFAVWWLVGVKGRLTVEEQEVFFRRYLELNPSILKNSNDAKYFRQEMRRIWLAKLSQAERVELYWDAVSNGAAKLPVGDELHWMEALRSAATEGLQEFLPVIERRKVELDKTQRVSGSQTSDLLKWDLRLRVGARNSDEGLVLQVERLRSMHDSELFDLFEKDAAFRDVVGGGGHVLCDAGFEQVSPGAGPEKRLEACSAMGSVLERMVRYELNRVKSGQAKRTVPGGWDYPDYPGPLWLKELHGTWVDKLPAESRTRIDGARQELQRAGTPKVQQQ